MNLLRVKEIAGKILGDLIVLPPIHMEAISKRILLFAWRLDPQDLTFASLPRHVPLECVTPRLVSIVPEVTMNPQKYATRDVALLLHVQQSFRLTCSLRHVLPI